MTDFYHNRVSGLDAIHELMWIGSTDPATVPANDVQPFQWWLDTTGGATLSAGAILKYRNSGNSAWTTVADLATALALKAPLASPALTGNPTAPTQSPGDNSTKLATTAYADAIASGGIADNSVTNAKLRDSSALSVIGRSANSTGDPADISAGSDGLFLGRASSALSFQAVTDALLSTSDIATNDRSTSKHGFGQKLPNDATKFEDGTGSFRTLTELDVGAATHDAGNTSTALTIDWSVATQQKCTLTGNATITHSNMVSGKVYTLEVYTGAGSFTCTFASTNWPGGTAPTATATASKVDVFTFDKLISGTILGAVFGQSFAP
jgi:hypothetical protein